MDFGKIPIKELEEITFKLPKDASGNTATLKAAKTKKQLVYVGCAKWGRTEWIGKIYPKGTKAGNFLDEYAKHYNSIELNASSYRFPKPEQIEEWVSRVHTNNFKFCPKAHQSLSFVKTSANKARQTADFIRNVRFFGGMLGPIFITIKSAFKEADMPEFIEWLKTLPTDIQFFVEIRDADFFANKKFKESFFNELRQLKIGAVITDTSGRQDVLHMQLTVPKTFVRFVGNSLHPSDYRRIDNWITRIKKWLDEGIEEIYFFMHMHDEAKSPELSQYLIEQLNKKCKLGLAEIKFVE
ncbi:MAG: DUF72 domain-containing protein [Chitinophagaceae bacterium]